MKNLLALLLVVVLTCSCACAELVIRYGTITHVDERNWIMNIETEDGNIWETEIKDELWEGDDLAVIFDTCGTNDPTDDIIESVHTARWFDNVILPALL